MSYISFFFWGGGVSYFIKYFSYMKKILQSFRIFYFEVYHATCIARINILCTFLIEQQLKLVWTWLQKI